MKRAAAQNTCNAGVHLIRSVALLLLDDGHGVVVKRARSLARLLTYWAALCNAWNAVELGDVVSCFFARNQRALDHCESLRVPPRAHQTPAMLLSSPGNQLSTTGPRTTTVEGQT